MRKYILFACFAFTLISCKKAEMTKDEISVTEIELPASTSDKAVSSPDSSESQKNSEQKIVKNGKLRFETTDFGKTANKIYTAVKKYKAQIQTDNEGKEYNSLTRNIVIRVSNENFENILRDISTGIAYFDQKEISSEDVTEQFIDLEARLKAKKELESRYLELLKKANKISEILEIEKELVVIREEIESKQGQLNYLQSRVSMSTLEITFYKQTVETGVTVSYGSKMWNAIKGGVSWIPGFFLGLLYIWPLILISGLAFYYIRKRKKNFKNKTE